MSNKRTYAETTKVPVSRSRGEIERLLRNWGCSAIGWFDDYDSGAAELRFVWRQEGRTLSCRMRLTVPVGDDHGAAQRRRQLHRVLLVKLKGDFNAVEAGLASTAEVLLPYLEAHDGRTLGDAIQARLYNGQPLLEVHE